MKKFLACFLCLCLLSCSVFAEGIDTVDENEVEENYEPEVDNSGTELNTGETEEINTEENADNPEGGENTEGLENGDAENSEEVLIQEGQENESTGAADSKELPESFVVIDADMTLVASSGAAYSIDLSSMTHIFFLAALNDKYSKPEDFEKIKVPDEYEIEGGDGIDLSPGEEVQGFDLYNSIYMRSSRDAALLLADKVYGGEEEAVKAVKDKLSSLGLANTDIVSLSQSGNTSTPYDLAKIYAYCVLNSELFNKISSAPYITISETDMNTARNLQTTSAFMIESSDYYDDKVLRGKTDYSDTGSYIIITSVKLDNHELFIVSSGVQTQGDANIRHANLQKKILSDYVVTSYILSSKILKTFKGEDKNREEISIKPSKDVVLVLPKNIDVKKSLEIRYDFNAVGENKSGETCKIEIYKDGNLFKSVPGTISKGADGGTYLGEVKTIVREKSAFEKIYAVLSFVFKIVLILILWFIAVIINRWRIRKNKIRARKKGKEQQ